MHSKRLVCLVAAALGVSATATTVSASAASLGGAGSSLVAPLVNEWAQTFRAQTGNVVQYGSVGSGTGVKDVAAGLVDFGASDAPLSVYSGTCGSCKQIPWALSATGLGYNIPGVGNGLQLSGSVLAKIYLGQITRWNDPAIKRANKHVHLPNLAITPVWRSDGSGDTYVYTFFLSKTSSAWRTRIGSGTTVGFPAGVGKKGNSGVATEVSNTTGAIGYISASYLIAQRISVAKVQNAARKYEYPNLNNIKAAASSLHGIPANNQVDITYPSKHYKTAYPISTFTYAMVPASPPKAALLKQWLTYCVTGGRFTGASLDFAPIPHRVQVADENTINSL